MITIVKPRGIIETGFENLMPLLERAGRTCYRSEDKITDGSSETFIQNIIKRGHESVLEHASVSVRIICDRSCSHQLVRHRIAAYSQESQRYCDYGKKGCQVICPPSIGLISGSYWIIPPDMPLVQGEWLHSVISTYSSYLRLRQQGIKPEDARSVLTNAVKTEVFTTFNLRQWRHVFKERGLNNHAQWQIRGIFRDLLETFALKLPAVFGDLKDVF